MNAPRSDRCNAGWFLAFALLLGCSSETIEDLKKKVGQGVDEVKGAGKDATNQVAGLGSHLKLQMGETVEAKACFASLTRLSGSRPAVLQLTSYLDPKHESFPSVLIWAEAPSHQADSLAGQKIKARIYVQPKADGPVWQSAADEPIELSISKASAQELAGEITSGKLVSSEGGAGVELRGSFGSSVRGDSGGGG
jgi:hypothetical protein